MDIVKELRGGADDPMWAHHCEMPKRIAKAAADEIEKLRAALRLFVEMPEKFEEPDFLNGIGQMRRAFANARAVLDASLPTADEVRGIFNDRE